jgi:hypothetical protein
VSTRRVRSKAQSSVVVGWTEVWSTSPDGFVHEGSVPLTLPRITARYENGRYQLRERKPLVLPHTGESQ